MTRITHVVCQTKKSEANYSESNQRKMGTLTQNGERKEEELIIIAERMQDCDYDFGSDREHYNQMRSGTLMSH